MNNFSYNPYIQYNPMFQAGGEMMPMEQPMTGNPMTGNPMGGGDPTMDMLMGFLQSQGMSEQEIQQFLQEFQQMSPQEQQEVLQYIQQEMQGGQEMAAQGQPMGQPMEQPMGQPMGQPMPPQSGGMQLQTPSTQEPQPIMQLGGYSQPMGMQFQTGYRPITSINDLTGVNPIIPPVAPRPQINPIVRSMVNIKENNQGFEDHVSREPKIGVGTGHQTFEESYRNEKLQEKNYKNIVRHQKQMELEWQRSKPTKEEILQAQKNHNLRHPKYRANGLITEDGIYGEQTRIALEGDREIDNKYREFTNMYNPTYSGTTADGSIITRNASMEEIYRALPNDYNSNLNGFFPDKRIYGKNTSEVKKLKKKKFQVGDDEFERFENKGTYNIEYIPESDGFIFEDTPQQVPLSTMSPTSQEKTIAVNTLPSTQVSKSVSPKKKMSQERQNVLKWQKEYNQKFGNQFGRIKEDGSWGAETQKAFEQSNYVRTSKQKALNSSSNKTPSSSQPSNVSATPPVTQATPTAPATAPSAAPATTQNNSKPWRAYQVTEKGLQIYVDENNNGRVFNNSTNKWEYYNPQSHGNVGNSNKTNTKQDSVKLKPAKIDSVKVDTLDNSILLPTVEITPDKPQFPYSNMPFNNPYSPFILKDFIAKSPIPNYPPRLLTGEAPKSLKLYKQTEKRQDVFLDPKNHGVVFNYSKNRWEYYDPKIHGKIQ